MSTRRVIDWRIQPGDGDHYTLYFRNKQVMDDQSMVEINKHLRNNRSPGQTVHQVADDGYITDVTRGIDRRQPTRRRSPVGKRRRPVRMPLIRF